MSNWTRQGSWEMSSSARLLPCNGNHGDAPCPDPLTVTNDEPAPDEVTTFEFGIELGLLLFLAIAAMAWIVIKVV